MEKSEKLLTWPDGLPVYDHIVIVVMENKDYEEVIDNPDIPAPYINRLKGEGANFSQMHGEEHLSQGNYFWMFSGDNQNVGFNDEVPNEENNPNYPFQASNLGEQLIRKGLSFKGYSEDLPAIGSVVEEDGLYARKHVPWISFANVPNGTTVATSSNLRWTDFPAPGQYDTLPTVSFVVPNMVNNMHNDENPDVSSVTIGDRWLEENLDSYYQWAVNNNSLLIVTFDENNDQRMYRGLTNPLINEEYCNFGRDPEYCADLKNRIFTVFVGAHVKPGDYDEGEGVTHVNILRTIEAMYGLPKSGKQQPNAAGMGITDDYIITDVFAGR